MNNYKSVNMNSKFNYDDGKYILLKDLLNDFNLDLSLSSELLNLEIDSIFKLSSLTIENQNVYKFKLEDCLLVIDLLNEDRTFSEYTYEEHDGNLLLSGYACYNSKGSITCIS